MNPLLRIVGNSSLRTHMHNHRFPFPNSIFFEGRIPSGSFPPAASTHWAMISDLWPSNPQSRDRCRRVFTTTTRSHSTHMHRPHSRHRLSSMSFTFFFFVFSQQQLVATQAIGERQTEQHNSGPHFAARGPTCSLGTTRSAAHQEQLSPLGVQLHLQARCSSGHSAPCRCICSRARVRTHNPHTHTHTHNE